MQASPYCQNAANPSPTFSGGGVAGTFSSTAGLVFVSTATGQINLAASTPGTYTVTNTIAASGGCAAVTATSSITITALPVATFSYAGSPYCQNAANPSPTFSGGGVAGTFSSTAGLVFVSTATGQINLSASTPGTYTVTNTIAACWWLCCSNSNKFYYDYYFTCGNDQLCRNSILYFTCWCTGCNTDWYCRRNIFFHCRINDQCSNRSDHTKFKHCRNLYGYLYDGCGGGCAAQTATTSVTITALPVATFSYAASPYCQNAANPSPTFSGGGVAGTFSSTAGLVFVSTARVRLIYLRALLEHILSLIPLQHAGGCAAVTATSSITITALPVATFSYAASPYCQNAANPSPTFSGGGVAGTFSSTAGLVFVSTATGQINLSASTPGTYTVTNTIAACWWLCSSNSDKFYYYNYITCSNDQLCRNSILYFTCWCAGCNTDRHSGWNIFFYCRINNQCSNRSDHSEYKHCRNLYGYLYNGCRWRMCCTDSNDFCTITLYRSYIQLCRNTILSECSEPESDI